MGKKRTYYIDRFDRGIQQSPRAQFEDPSILGFTHCAHFDVFSDPTRLIPMPGFEEQRGTANAADVLGLQGMGGNATKVYASGKALSNWYQPQWGYRIQITPDATYYNGTGTFFTFFDLSNMPATFWDNVHSTGKDVRVTTSDGVTEVATHLTGFDAVAKTGALYIKGSIAASGHYIYYGNEDATQYSFDDTYGQQSVFSNFLLAYTFDSDDEYVNPVAINSYELTGAGSDYAAASAPIGGGTSAIRYLASAPNAGDNMTIAVALSRGTTTGVKELFDYRSVLRVTLRADNKLDVRVAHTSGFNVYTTTNALPASTHVLLTVTIAGNDIKVYFDDVVEINQTASENGDLDYSSGYLNFYNAGGFIYDFCLLDNSAFSAAVIESYSNNFLNNSSFWSAGTQLALPDLTKTYDGFQLYEKRHDADDWTAVIDSNTLGAISREDYPTMMPIAVKSDLTAFLTRDAASGGDTWLGTFTEADGISARVLNLGETGNRYPTFSIGADNNLYLSYGQKVYAVTSGTATEVFDTGKDIWSTTSFRDTLGIATEENEQNIVETYDFARTDPVSTLDFGPGQVMLISDLHGYLIGVAVQNVYDVFEEGTTNDATKPGGLAILSSGGGDGIETIFHNISAKTDPTDSGRRPPIAQSSFKRKNSFIALGYFGDDAEKIGVWEIGLNRSGHLALNLLVKMPSGPVWDSIWGGYNFIYFKDSDANSHKQYRLKSGLSDSDYDQTALFETTALGQTNPTTREQIRRVTIRTDNLNNGSIVLKFRRKESDAWTTLFTWSDVGEQVKHITRTSDGLPLPTFYEGQLRLENTGNNKITEFKVETEELSS